MWFQWPDSLVLCGRRTYSCKNSMLFQKYMDFSGCGLNLLHLSIFTFNYTTHAILTQVVFTFWAMPWEMIQWIIMNRTTVITSPPSIELGIHIMRVSFVKRMLVKWCVLWFKAFLTDIKFTFFTMPRESKRVQMAVLCIMNYKNYIYM